MWARAADTNAVDWEVPDIMHVPSPRDKYSALQLLEADAFDIFMLDASIPRI